MREIKFRGKRVGNREWFYGNLCAGVNIHRQSHFDVIQRLLGCSMIETHEVVTKTVGQFTGLYDRNKKEIYEGDILDCSYINPMSKEIVKRLFVVEFEKGTFKVKCIGHSPYGDTLLYFENEKGVVIGNIHDNPELLGGDIA